MRRRLSFERYHERRANLLWENYQIAWTIFFVIGAFFSLIHLIVQDDFIFGMALGFLGCAVIIPLLNLIFYFPEVKRLLGAMKEELR